MQLDLCECHSTPLMISQPWFRQWLGVFMASNKTLTEPMLIPRGGGGGGGYSLCGGWYICAAVLTPFFRFGRIEHDLFGVLFLIRQQQSYLLGYKNYQFLQKSIFLAPNSIFSSIFWGPIFSGQRHTPISFQAEYPPGLIQFYVVILLQVLSNMTDVWSVLY